MHHGPSAHAAWLLLLCLGCSWSRFDDVVENAPIVLLNRPKTVKSGFGSSLASASAGGEATLLVGGLPKRGRAAAFSLGNSDAPILDAVDRGHCEANQCMLADSPVALARAQGPASTPDDLCFVDGGGRSLDVEGGGAVPGVVVRCNDDVEYALPVPAKVAELIDARLAESQATPLHFGADRGPDAGLLATADEETAVWFYPSLSRSFVDIENPAAADGRWDRLDADKGQRRTLAVARVGATSRLLAVGTPHSGQVRLFYAADGQRSSYVGCLGGPSGFGRAFATGPVTAGDDDDELVVSDDSLVYVFDAKALSSLVPTTATDCSLGALPAGALVTSFGCGSTKNISGCDVSAFGAALGVGDLDGDGDGEVVVGAPNMTVRHHSGAGAVIIYDVDPPQTKDAPTLHDFRDIAFLSSAEVGDQLGSSLSLPSLGKRQVLAAGAPESGKVALFYCPSFLPAELAGNRCH